MPLYTDEFQYRPYGQEPLRKTATPADVKQWLSEHMPEMVLVPREPSEEMIEAACITTCKECHGDCRCGPYAGYYKAMIAAAEE